MTASETEVTDAFYKSLPAKIEAKHIGFCYDHARSLERALHAAEQRAQRLAEDERHANALWKNAELELAQERAARERAEATLRQVRNLSGLHPDLIRGNPVYLTALIGEIHQAADAAIDQALAQEGRKP